MQVMLALLFYALMTCAGSAAVSTPALVHENIDTLSAARVSTPVPVPASARVLGHRRLLPSLPALRSWTLASLFSTGSRTPAPTPLADPWLHTFQTHFPNWIGGSSATRKGKGVAKPDLHGGRHAAPVSQIARASGSAPTSGSRRHTYHGHSDTAMARMQAKLKAEQTKIAALQRQRREMASSSQQLETEVQKLKARQGAQGVGRDAAGVATASGAGQGSSRRKAALENKLKQLQRLKQEQEQGQHHRSQRKPNSSSGQSAHSRLSAMQAQLSALKRKRQQQDHLAALRARLAALKHKRELQAKLKQLQELKRKQEQQHSGGGGRSNGGGSPGPRNNNKLAAMQAQLAALKRRKQQQQQQQTLQKRGGHDATKLAALQAQLAALKHQKSVHVKPGTDRTSIAAAAMQANLLRIARLKKEQLLQAQLHALQAKMQAHVNQLNHRNHPGPQPAACLMPTAMFQRCNAAGGLCRGHNCALSGP